MSASADKTLSGSLPSDYLTYPERSYGMDHDLYQWSMLTDRKPITWPEGKKLALWVNVSVQFFPMDQKGIPFKVPGGMTMPYPDLRHFSLRDYGNRVGIFRILKALDQYQVKATFAINSRLVEQAPYLVHKIAERGDEILCHGWDMDSINYGNAKTSEESGEGESIKKAIDLLRQATGQPIKGWLSPAKNQSENTAKYLQENGIDYCCDWVNDDMPYLFNINNQSSKQAGSNNTDENNWNMPLSTELDDQFILQTNLHSEESYLEQICDACDFLLEEANEQGGRILALNIHPWMLGQPHRIKFLEQALEYIMAKPEVWSASASDILAQVKAQA